MRWEVNEHVPYIVPALMDVLCTFKDSMRGLGV